MVNLIVHADVCAGAKIPFQYAGNSHFNNSSDFVNF